MLPFNRRFSDITLTPFEFSSATRSSYLSSVAFLRSKAEYELSSYYDNIRRSHSNIEGLMDVYARVFGYVWTVVYGTETTLRNVIPPFVYSDFSLLLDFQHHFPKTWLFSQIYRFLDALLYVYLHGSTYENIQHALGLFLETTPEITENFRRIGDGTFDISDTHSIEVMLPVSDTSYFFGSYILATEFLRKIRPAHVLCTTGIIFREMYSHNVSECVPYSGWNYYPSIVECLSVVGEIGLEEIEEVSEELFVGPLIETCYRHEAPCGGLFYDGESSCLGTPVYDSCYIYDGMSCPVTIEIVATVESEVAYTDDDLESMVSV